jgi:hypothetical protein
MRFAISGLAALMACGSLALPAAAQSPAFDFRKVVIAARSAPGVLGVETGQTASGRQVIFAWFEDKKSIVAWYRSEVHQKAIKAVFPDRVFDREPLPDLPENSGPILAIVSIKLTDSPKPSEPGSFPAFASIGIELYTPLPGGVAVGGRFAPDSLKVPGLRELDVPAAQGRPR